LRFRCELGFALDREILKTIPQVKEKLMGVAKERIFQELNRIFLSGRAAVGLHLMRTLELEADVFSVPVLSRLDVKTWTNLQTGFWKFSQDQRLELFWFHFLRVTDSGIGLLEKFNPSNEFRQQI